MHTYCDMAVNLIFYHAPCCDSGMEPILLLNITAQNQPFCIAVFEQELDHANANLKVYPFISIFLTNASINHHHS